MRAVLPYRESSQRQIHIEVGEVEAPRPGPGEVLVNVRAAALNRADLLQMRGLYPPPPGESAVPGLECSGEIVELGPDVSSARIGDRIMALLAGGGQGEQVVVPEGQLMPIPDGLSFAEAAALPETALTSWTNLVAEGGLQSDENVLITAAASGIGTFAAQLARELTSGKVLAAGRNIERLQPLRDLGADACLELGEGLPDAVREACGGKGVDLVIELAGGENVAHSLKALERRGRVVLVGVLAGPRAEIDLGDVLRRRLRLIGSVLRARPRDEKARLIGDFSEFARGRFADGRLRPIIHRIRPFAEIAEAYAEMQEGGVFGKLIVEM